jgi:lipoate---protein ligase
VVSAPRWRVWICASPAVVLGCSQRHLREDVERRLCGRAAVVQRDSGGGAVLTGPWLVSTSLVLPHAHPWVGAGLIESYRQLAQTQVAALAEFGVPSRAVPPQELPRADRASADGVLGWACFAGLSPWEVVDAQGRKLVGLAQRKRQSGVLLVAGALIGAAHWPLLCAAFGAAQDEPTLRQRTVCAEEVAGRRIEPERFAGAVARFLERALSVTVEDTIATEG